MKNLLKPQFQSSKKSRAFYRPTVQPMLKLLPKLSGPYFDFLVLPVGECWERRGCLKNECFHHPEALRIQDDIVSVFVGAFTQSHPYFNYYGPTEYQGEGLSLLGQLLNQWIEAIRSCRTPKQFQARLPMHYSVDYWADDLGDWHPQWRRVRNELEIYGQQILRRTAQAEREQKALLVMGV